MEILIPFSVFVQHFLFTWECQAARHSVDFAIFSPNNMENVCRWELVGVAVGCLAIIYVGVASLLQGSVTNLPHINVNKYQLISLLQQRIFHPGSKHSQPPRPLLLHRSGEPRPSKDISISVD